MAFIAGLAGKEQRADLLNTVVAMGLGLAGGCMFPAEQLPLFLREGVTPFMPTRWFVVGVRELQSGIAGHVWLSALFGLLGLGLASLWASTLMFGRRLQRGTRA
jgi:hypothetical protein